MIRSRVNRWLAVALFAGLFAPSSDRDAGPRRAVARGAEEDALLSPAVLAAFQGGPIELKPWRGPVDGFITQEKAAQIAQRYLGSPIPPTRACLAEVTDHEFMGGLLNQRPCWLLEYANVTIAEANGDTPAVKVSGYAVVDAKKGVFWQAFTKPTAPWWRQVNLKNEAVVKRHSQMGHQAHYAPAPPKATLYQILQDWNRNGAPEDPLKAKQLIFRYLRYSDTTWGTSISRVDGLEMIPKFAETPGWYISFEGIHTRLRPDDDFLEEANCFYDAEGSRQFTNYYR